MGMSRRAVLRWAGSMAAWSALATPAFAAEAPESRWGLRERVKAGAKIRSIEVLRSGRQGFVRTTTADGAVGLAITSERLEDVHSLLTKRVIPYFIGKDARDIESLVDGVYTNASNYKYAGLAFWCSVSWVEFSIMDLLGKMAGKPVGELLGGVVRQTVPVYLSSLRRDTTPEQEVEWVGRRLEETGAKAVKLKIGGRMSRNADAAPGRTERLVALARKTLGEQVAIYVDSNGSYDAEKAIKVGKMLEAHAVGFYEEPCPFEEYAQTKRVADALTIPVAGGEQDTSLPRLREMIQTRTVDIVQPDVSYCGGFVRSIRVAEMASARGMAITPHSPKADPNEAYMLHFIGRTANAGAHQEYDAAPRAKANWYAPSLEVRGGAIEVPTGPGLGITYDPRMLEKAERI